MSSFKGTYKYSLDAKGRVSIPAPMRKAMSPEANETFVITKGLDGCLFIYPLDEWVKIERRLKNLPMNQKDSRYYVRTMAANAVESSYDRQGRIAIPAYLAEDAKIEKEVLIIGLFNRIEIWSPQIYDDYIANNPETFESVAEKINFQGDGSQ